MRAGTVDRALVAVAALSLTLLAAYAVSGRHRFSGPLLFPVTPEHGVHLGDLAVLALWSAGLGACAVRWQRLK